MDTSREENCAKKNSSYKKGVLSGILISLIFFLIFNLCTNLYYRFIKKEMSTNYKISKIIKTIDKNYANEYKPEMLEEGIYSGIVASLNDKYSYYMTEEQFKDFMDSTNGTYVGIGVIIRAVENELRVLYVFEDCPAQAGGIKAGDFIKAVDSVSVTADNYNEIIKKIKDEKNMHTTITVYRESENKEIEIKIDKNKIDVPTVSHKMLEDNIGYIMISKFEAVTAKQFDNAFNSLTNDGMKALIIDLRDNPGGLLNVVTEITDKLVPKGYITYTEDKNGEKKYLYSDEDCFSKPLVILVNENSASASEVLSGAVKDMGAGKLVGTKTFGKGVVQTIFKLGDGSGMKLTVAKYYTPSGVCIDGIGIEPDYKVEFDKDFDFKNLTEENDVQLKKGIEVIKGMLS